MKVKLILDRFEGYTAVLTDESGDVYECSRELLPNDAGEDDLYNIEISDGRIISAERIKNPSAGENKIRLKRLFDKNKKRND